VINLIIISLSFLFTVGATPYFINFLLKFGIVDKPNGDDRHIHTEPIPRLGGIIIIAVIISITFTFYHDLISKIYFITGAFVVFGLGLADDLKEVKWHLKFIIQSIATILLVVSFNNNNFNVIQFMGYTLPPGLNYFVLFILILGLLNAFNLMDGLDGLVSGYSLIIATMCFLLNMGSNLIFFNYLSAAIIGSTLGFLKFNANPARIFLGDSGSLILGYFITGLVIATSSLVAANTANQAQIYSNSIDLTFIIIALAVPIADTLRVMIVRLHKGKHIFLADTSHLHHLLYSKNIEHKTAVAIVHLFSIIFVLLAIYYARISKPAALIIFAVMLLSLFAIKQILNFIISKDHLLNYIRVYKKVPDVLPRIYRKFLLPVVSILLFFLFITLIISEVSQGQSYNKYFLIFILPALLYSSTTLRKNNYYAELLVLINIIIFFIITGFNGFFYKMYSVPLFEQLNINQILLAVLSGMIIFFVLFKERIANISMRFLTGTDLTIAVLILFIYIAVQFINLPEPYKISDTLIRSFLIFIFYKIIIVTVPRIHFPLYYMTFVVTILALTKSLI
jgi:UDP-GlcNAc:undecaprenyl-phosphate/decaprenyl-phosphate GlcNAc-1-phosphate transferase